MWMARKFPKQVLLDADEIERVNRVRVAKWLGVTPAEVDAMPQADYDDVSSVMWADAQN